MIPAGLDVPGCEEIAEKLSDFLDGELEPAAAARFAVHLAGCPRCARLAVELDATIRALHRLSRRTAGPSGVLH